MDRILSEDEINKYLNRYCFNSMCRGLVKFVGYLEGKEGVWLGIEWDSVDRGKHSGYFDGVRYFDCKTGCGSFIRPNKVTFNRGIVDAIMDRYQFEEKDKAGIEGEDIATFNDNKDLSLKIYPVGLEKFNVKTSEQPLIDLSGYGVSFDDSKGELEPLISSTTELNLSYNLFKHFKELFSIVSQLPSVTTLNISHNPFDLSTMKEFYKCESTNSGDADSNQQLKSDGQGSNTPTVTFDGVKTLFMNRLTSYWCFFESFVRFFPNLTTLSLCFNGLQHLKVTTDLAALNNITHINLHGNHLSEWKEIEQLRKLKSLQTLIISQNKFCTIQSDMLTNPNKSDYFESLQTLDLANNNFLQIQDILALSSIPTLKSLQCLGNPFFLCPSKDELYSLRSKVISLFPNIETLNGTKINNLERDECELWFIKNSILEVRQIIAEKSRQSGSGNEILSEMPSANNSLPSGDKPVDMASTTEKELHSNENEDPDDSWQPKSALMLADSLDSSSDQFDPTILYELYPTIDTLLNKHKIQLFDLIDSVKLPKTKTTLRSTLWDVLVIFENQEIKLSIPYTTKMKRIIKIASRIFGKEIEGDKLYCVCRKTSQKHHIDYLDQDLEYNGLQNNDLIMIGHLRESEK